MSKFEVAYRAMQLPLVMQSFNEVEVEGCYWRATLLKSLYDPDTLVYSDRTKYAAYAERRDSSTLLKGLNHAEVDAMNLREFCETVNCHFKRGNNETTTRLSKREKLKLCTRAKRHWVLGTDETKASWPRSF